MCVCVCMCDKHDNDKQMNRHSDKATETKTNSCVLRPSGRALTH